MTELYTFAAAFGLVFALAFQSLNTNRGHYMAAFLMSWVIGGFQLYILKAIPLSSTWTVDLAYLAGGPVGALVAMYVHPRWMKKK